MKVGLVGFIVFWVQSAFGQVSLDIENAAYPFVAQDYFIAGVEDLRPSKYFLGRVYLQNGEKTDLLLRNGTEQSFFYHTERNLKQNKQGVPLYVKVKTLNYLETLKPDGRVEGKAFFEIDVYGIIDAKEELICSSNGGGFQYERTLGPIQKLETEQLLQKMWISSLKNINAYIERHIENLEAFNTGSEIVFLDFKTQNVGDTVHYFSRKVNWNDFRGLPPPNSKFAAAIYSSIGIGTRYTLKNRKLIAEIQPMVYMIPSQSWVKEAAKTEASLKHEQVHFDITNVAMQLLMLKLKAIEADNLRDLSSAVQYAYLEAYRDMNKLQKKYDAESNHGLNVSGQFKWETWVNNFLENPRLHLGGRPIFLKRDFK